MREGSAVDNRILELLDLVNLSNSVRATYPRHLSGGQRQRVSIARALATEPGILVADEPVSALDVSVQAAILNLFAELRKELGLTLVMISHNLAVVRHTSDSVVVMYGGRVVEHGRTADVLERPEHDYTKSLLASVPSLVPRTRRTPDAVQLSKERPDGVGDPARSTSGTDDDRTGPHPLPSEHHSDGVRSAVRRRVLTGRHRRTVRNADAGDRRSRPARARSRVRIRIPNAAQRYAGVLRVEGVPLGVHSGTARRGGAPPRRSLGQRTGGRCRRWCRPDTYGAPRQRQDRRRDSICTREQGRVHRHRQPR